MIRLLVLLLFCSVIRDGVFAQSPWQRRVTAVGNLGLSVTNTGPFGRPDVRNTPQGDPSMEYPLNSGIEHLFEGGLWIGAIVNGQKVVSTASVDAPAGYVAGAQGFEFSPLSPITERSTLTSSEFFSLNAVSHQDLVFDMTDRFTIVNNQPITGHLNPLQANVHVETYAWNYSFADFFVLFNYTIVNNSSNTWDSVWLGFWTDLIVRNVNVATDGGAAFFNKGGGGFIDSLSALYVYDISGDPGYTNSYGAIQFLGIEWRNQFLHPNNAQNIVAAGLPGPKVNANFWVFRSFQGTTFVGPFNFDGTFDDLKAYEKMSTGLDFNNQQILTDLAIPGNRTQLLTAGPLVSLEPGESVNLAFALVCARQLEDNPKDSPYARTKLFENLNWSKRTYLGEDLNENGILDEGEDLNGNGILDRYILPEPPVTPAMRLEVSSQKVTVYWDDRAEASVDPITKKEDFEGYRLYRTKVGDDFSLDMLGALNQIGQWDKKGNNIGFNNGFSSIRLPQPVTFPDDTIQYWYKYELDNLLNGWQYLIVLTAFDEGSPELGLESLETSFVENARYVFPGTSPNEDMKKNPVGVYPNPYRLNAAWDGPTDRTRKLYFYNLPERCEITIYTLSGDVVARLSHDADTYTGSDIRWFNNFAGPEDKRIHSGGEHAWDLLSETRQRISQGVYLYSVKNLRTGELFQGNFAVLK